MDNFSDIFTLEGAGFKEVGNYRYQVKCLHVTEAYRLDISAKQKFIIYSSGRYSKTKRDIVMGHKGGNYQYLKGSKRCFEKIGCGAFLCVFLSPKVG